MGVARFISTPEEVLRGTADKQGARRELGSTPAWDPVKPFSLPSTQPAKLSACKVLQLGAMMFIPFRFPRAEACAETPHNRILCRDFVCRLKRAMPEITHKPLIILPGPTSDPSAEKGNMERRGHSRIPFTASAEVLRHTHSRTRLLGRTSDLSASGCYIDTLSPFAARTPRFDCASNTTIREFEAAAVVVYSAAPMGMGLTFTELQPEQLDILKAWTGKLNSDPLPEPEVAAATPEAEIETADSNPRLVLYELINLMVRKKLITEKEGTGLLRQMFH